MTFEQWVVEQKKEDQKVTDIKVLKEMYKEEMRAFYAEQETYFD